MDDKNSEFLRNFLGGTSMDTAIDPLAQIEQLQNFMSRLEQGVTQLSHGMQQMSMEINLGKLSTQMLFNIIIEKGIMTKEELNDKYKTDVVDAMMRLQEDIQKKTEKAIEEMQKEQEIQDEKQEEVQEAIEEEEEEEETGEPILASERAKETIRFNDNEND